MSEYTDSNYTSWGCNNHKVKEGVETGRQWKEIDSLIETKFGYVRGFSWFFQKAFKTTSLTIIKDGRIYERRFDKAYSGKYMVTLAKKFADDVFSVKE